MHINKKRLFIISYSVICFALIIWLLSSNEIIASLNRNLLAKDNFENYLENERALYAIDEVEIYNDLGENVKIRGWSFVNLPIEEDNPEKMIKLIFLSSDQCYSTEVQWPQNTEIPIFWYFAREDVKKTYSNFTFGSQPPGFVGEFSTLPMKNGIYKLYIYCYENESHYGLVDTGKTFLKNNREFYEYEESI